MSLKDVFSSFSRPVVLLRAARARGRRVAVDVGRTVLEGLDERIPEGVRERMPEVGVEVAGQRYRVRGLKIWREQAPVVEAEAPAEAFFGSLPRGTRMKGDDEPIVEGLPRSTDDVRQMIQKMRDTIDGLDDVKDYGVVDEVDDDMYQLWRELERKMQRHRQSEAKHQLKDMFSI